MRVLSVVMSLLMVLSVISFPTLKASAEGGVDGFVERCYTVTLDRGSDPEGFADWKDQLLNGKSVGVNIAYGFLFSQEYKNKNKSNKDYVKDLYKLFMDREPDEAGFNDWVGKLEEGKSREEVFAGFANSQEFYNICESYGITAGFFAVGYDRNQVNNVNLFVERLYQTCLGRRGDRGGQKDWVNKLLKKEITGAECSRCFIQSKEYVNKGLSDEDYVENMYKAMMGRASDPAGKESWLAALGNGKTRDEVFAGFANSKEFGDICAAYKIDKGSYTAQDIGTSKETGEESQNKGFRAVKREFSNGEYTVLDYKYGQFTHSEKRYDKNGNLKGYDYFEESDSKGYNQKRGARYYDETNSEMQYEFHLKVVTSDDKKKVTQYEYSDEWNTVSSYTVFDSEEYTYTNGDITYTSIHYLSGTSYSANGTKEGSMTYKYDKYNRRIEAKQYGADGNLYWVENCEFYDKVGAEEQYKKSITTTYYNYLGEAYQKNVTEYDMNGNIIKEAFYSDGELDYYYINEYDSNGRGTKTTAYSGDGKQKYCYVYERDADGRFIKEIDYDENGNITGYMENEFDSQGRITRTVRRDPDKVAISITEYTFDANGNLVRFLDWDGTDNYVTKNEYDKNGNLTKITKDKNGTVLYWEKITYEEYSY